MIDLQSCCSQLYINCYIYYEGDILHQLRFLIMNRMDQVIVVQQIKQIECKSCQMVIPADSLQYHNTVCLLQKVKCAHCGSLIVRLDMDYHNTVCFYFPVSCEYCKESITRINYSYHCSKKHYKNVKNPFPVPPQFKQADISQFKDWPQTCKWCNEREKSKVVPLNMHQTMCKSMLLYQDYLSNQRLALTPLQINALKKLNERSANAQLMGRKVLRSHLFEMGHGEDVEILMSQYIEHQAPIIIHFNLGKNLVYFNEDTNYKNLFETMTSGGSSSRSNRVAWENYLFDSTYDKARDEERVKYGVINLFNDQMGVTVCRNYGHAFMVLKKHVRPRCTFLHKRYYSQEDWVSTLKYNLEVLSKFNRAELEALYLTILGHEVRADEMMEMKEVHIHGPISFAEDIEVIYAPQADIDQNLNEVRKFTNRFKVEILPAEKMGSK